MSELDEHNNNFKVGFWISLLGHCVCVVFIVASALFSSFFKKEELEPKTFTLLSSPLAETQEVSTPTPTPEPTIKVKDFKKLEEIELPPAPVELPEPKPISKPEPENKIVEKPTPTAKDSNNAKPIKPEKVSAADFFKNRKQVKTPKSKPKNTDYNITKVKTGLPSNIKPISSSANSGGISNSEIDSYQNEVYSLLRRNWILPEECTGMDLVVGVRFTINSNGRVSNIKILNPSGELIFDKSVEKVLKSITFRSPPRGKSLTLAINFRAED